uniref:Uncharacterized protein n=1 Tax=Rhodomonas sp. (strain CS 24) TaxID=79257 RepID=Q9AVR3_RHDS2|nr:hypothetical protein [Rhodomonas sp. CS24]
MIPGSCREILRLRGGRKGVAAKHTSGEVASKTALATRNAGGGKAGLQDRKGGKAGHAKFICPECKMQAASMKNMQDHYDSKHPKDVLDPAACQNAQEMHGGSTHGVAVQGTQKAAKKKKKATAA